jgi:hypothetical protein
MALQTSGSISLEDIESEFGGGNPISIGDYYRGGSYVPASITTSTVLREPSSGESYIKENICWVKVSGTYQYTWVYWGNEKIFESTDNTLTSVVVNGKTYYRDSYRETDTQQTGFGGGNMMVYNKFYGIHRSSGSTTTTSVNGNVPTSGQISLSDFYGGRKT